mmetsp:Transcript_34975/g.62883  ORF Transcript_34975/g.62883 Transcript_34975/m.62883 type:complete len:1112 (-) Transcript_34975:183-3518(-)|eukprot:CAMPEP_0175046834 /NCGR_PEP_ID=MMETSP0052_2-20121109/5252_1 /TAXON_ID=51329 ORGANISM="Polytomella parva, Strain SAG 63-3" /NCGR_SAMPLE_ID=MMETSP0052_2 /ASSEMBLY_ACC=CAM_ASM_000194 /LENGTH=1111 /DNA_ID=CAMNT_0016310627 /DNA_START=65 /DNA_END=3400 /DNA_ORIENTATION=+
MSSVYDKITQALSTIGKRKRPIEACDSTPKSEGNKPAFRLYDQGSLYLRLESFTSVTWPNKLQLVDAENCALRGWVNVSRDTLRCEQCESTLIYPCREQSDSADAEDDEEAKDTKIAKAFKSQLSTGHSSGCPYRSVCCSRSMLHYVPNLTEAELCRRFKKRESDLLTIDILPDIDLTCLADLRMGGYSEALEYFILGKASTSSSRLSATSTDTNIFTSLHGNKNTSTPIRLGVSGGDQGSAPFSKLTVAQKARLLALLGWDMVVNDSSTNNTSNNHTNVDNTINTGNTYPSNSSMCSSIPHCSSSSFSLAHLQTSRSRSGSSAMGKGSVGGQGRANTSISLPSEGVLGVKETTSTSRRHNASSVVLKCTYCKSCISLREFQRETHLTPLGRLRPSIVARGGINPLPLPSSPSSSSSLVNSSTSSTTSTALPLSPARVVSGPFGSRSSTAAAFGTNGGAFGVKSSLPVFGLPSLDAKAAAWSARKSVGGGGGVVVGNEGGVDGTRSSEGGESKSGSKGGSKSGNGIRSVATGIMGHAAVAGELSNQSIPSIAVATPVGKPQLSQQENSILTLSLPPLLATTSSSLPSPSYNDKDTTATMSFATPLAANAVTNNSKSDSTISFSPLSYSVNPTKLDTVKKEAGNVKAESPTSSTKVGASVPPTTATRQSFGSKLLDLILMSGLKSAQKPQKKNPKRLQEEEEEGKVSEEAEKKREEERSVISTCSTASTTSTTVIKNEDIEVTPPAKKRFKSIHEDDEVVKDSPNALAPLSNHSPALLPASDLPGTPTMTANLSCLPPPITPRSDIHGHKKAYVPLQAQTPNHTPGFVTSVEALDPLMLHRPWCPWIYRTAEECFDEVSSASEIAALLGGYRSANNNMGDSIKEGSTPSRRPHPIFSLTSPAPPPPSPGSFSNYHRGGVESPCRTGASGLFPPPSKENIMMSKKTCGWQHLLLSLQASFAAAQVVQESTKAAEVEMEEGVAVEWEGEGEGEGSGRGSKVTGKNATTAIGGGINGNGLEGGLLNRSRLARVSGKDEGEKKKKLHVDKAGEDDRENEGEQRQEKKYEGGSNGGQMKRNGEEKEEGAVQEQGAEEKEIARRKEIQKSLLDTIRKF